MKSRSGWDVAKVSFLPSGGIIPELCSYLVAERESYKKVSKTTADALKIVANSMYGAICFDKYPSYSPIHASAVTGGGRWVLSVMEVVADALLKSLDPSSKVVYGDTDSICIASSASAPVGLRKDMKPKSMHNNVVTINKMVELILEFCPFPYIKAECKAIDLSIICMAPKMYVIKTARGTIDAKGISLVRRGGCQMMKDVEYDVAALCLSIKADEHKTLGSLSKELYLKYMARLRAENIHTKNVAYSYTLKGSTTCYYWSECDKNMKDKRRTVREFIRVEVEVDSSSYNDRIGNLFPKVSCDKYSELISDKINSILRAVDIHFSGNVESYPSV